MKFQVNLTIIPKPIFIWGLTIGESFTLTENGFNEIEDRYEIYTKISKTKAVLSSLSSKPVFLIPQLSPNDIGYRIVEEFILKNVN